MKKAVEDLLKIDQAVAFLYQKNPELRYSKFGYGYTRFHDKNVKPVVDEYKAEETKLEIDNALEDPKTKAVLYTEDRKNFQYSKEGLKKLNEQRDELFETFRKKEVKVEPYFIKEEDLPELNDEQRELMKGVLIE